MRNWASTGSVDRAVRALGEAVVVCADAQDALIFAQQQLAAVGGDIAFVLLAWLGVA
jgi:cob(I)alamin adenosyltransferase